MWAGEADSLPSVAEKMSAVTEGLIEDELGGKKVYNKVNREVLSDTENIWDGW